MLGEHGCDVDCLRLVSLLQPFAEPPVEVHTVSGPKPTIQDFLVERMLEVVASRHGSVRPLRHASRYQELAVPRQCLECPFHLQDGAARGAGGQGGGEFGAGSAADLEQVLFVGRQTIDVASDHLPQIARHANPGNRVFGAQSPVSVGRNDRVLRNKIVDQRDGNKRLPPGAPEHQFAQPVSHAGVTEARQQVLSELEG